MWRHDACNTSVRMARSRTTALAVLFTMGCDTVDVHVDASASCDELDLSPCERNACEACRELGGQLGKVDIYPPIYDCELPDGTSAEEFDGRDYCRRPWCEATVTTLDESGDLASASAPSRRLRAQALGITEAPLAWAPESPRAPLRTTPSAPTTLEIVATDLGAPIRVVRRRKFVPTTDGVPDVGPGAIICTHHLELDVELELRTADGGLRETLPARVDLTIGGDIEPYFTELEPHTRVELDRHELTGELEMHVDDPAFALADHLHADIVFGPTGIEGDLVVGAQWSDENGQWVGFGRELVAEWPTD
jgi:hypothetical protein